jgi:hypothetical protein
MANWVPIETDDRNRSISWQAQDKHYLAFIWLMPKRAGGSDFDYQWWLHCKGRSGRGEPAIARGWEADRRGAILAVHKAIAEDQKACGRA